eukprot:5159787-Prorocentrum_lima.AAC.1
MASSGRSILDLPFDLKPWGVPQCPLAHLMLPLSSPHTAVAQAVERANGRFSRQSAGWHFRIRARVRDLASRWAACAPQRSTELTQAGADGRR